MDSRDQKDPLDGQVLMELMALMAPVDSTEPRDLKETLATVVTLEKLEQPERLAPGVMMVNPEMMENQVKYLLANQRIQIGIWTNRTLKKTRLTSQKLQIGRLINQRSVLMFNMNIVTGSQGPKGFRGDPGVNGRDGVNGVPGSNGPVGDVGPRGPDGPQVWC